jgi:ubiquinone/menaquinone biosynthesis C-methylase UbiE
MTANYTNVTEIGGQPISAEQLERIAHRYHWAAEASRGHDVIEVACGAGQGLGILKSAASSLVGGDVSPEVLQAARDTYGDSISLSVFSAEKLPFSDNSFDVVLLFEALYYVPDVAAFFSEAARVLRPGGRLLITSANKDLFDFTPSPYSHRYLGVAELAGELSQHGFSPSFWGYIDIRQVPMRQRILRPAKLIASKLGLVPKTMQGKKLLKKLFFGNMTVMPSDLANIVFDYSPPNPIVQNAANTFHKVIYCEARNDSK